MQLINPKIRLEIRLGGEAKEILASGDPNHADIEFSISKDLSEEPNSAEITIYNANRETRDFLSQAGTMESLIDFYASTIEFPDAVLKLGFRGEIERVRNENLRPGFATHLYCTSQKINHREFWFQKTYSSGTRAGDIINDLKSEVGLPDGNLWLPSTETIILSKSFAGPAYELLQRFMFDRGMYCYIMDGKIYSSVVSIAPNGTARNIEDYALRGDPEHVIRNARNLIEMKTVEEVAPHVFSDPLLEDKKRKKRRRKKKKEIYGKDSFSIAEFEAVDQQIEGMVFNTFLQPDFNPDDMFRYKLLLYRAISVEHEGDTMGGYWDTTLTTDIYEDTGGDFT